MIRIPTGPIPKQAARTVSFWLGVVAAAVHVFKPQWFPTVTAIGSMLAPLGLTLGGTDESPLAVPK